MEYIRRKCNLMVDLSNFTSNKKMLSAVVVLVYNQVFFFEGVYNQVYYQTLSKI